MLIAAIAIAALVLSLTYNASAADVAPPQTYHGLTAEQWYQKAIIRTAERDTARAETIRVRAANRWLKGRIAHLRTPEISRSSRPPHYDAWLCIHRGEGSWTDPNAPYYGGLQMDYSFQRAYGADLLARKGTADHWTPLEQMWVAEKAWRTRGFGPWPQTARACGLL